MSTLFELNKAIADFELEVNEDGEVLNIDELDALELEKKEKLENIGLWIRNLEAEKDAVSNQKKIFADREARLGKKIDSLKGYLTYALGGQKFSTDKVSVSFRKSESVHITDEHLIDDSYMDVSVVKRPNKKVIKDALKAGKEVFGAELLEKQNISVK